MSGKLVLNRYKHWTTHACSISLDHRRKGHAEAVVLRWRHWPELCILHQEQEPYSWDCTVMAWVLSVPWPGSFGKWKCCVIKHLYRPYKSEDWRLCYLFCISFWLFSPLPVPGKLLPKLTLMLSSAPFTLFQVFHFYASHSSSSASLHHPVRPLSLV